jgi:hypothetical protein
MYLIHRATVITRPLSSRGASHFPSLGHPRKKNYPGIIARLTKSVSYSPYVPTLDGWTPEAEMRSDSHEDLANPISFVLSKPSDTSRSSATTGLQNLHPRHHDVLLLSSASVATMCLFEEGEDIRL